jgi:hypothetical protein
MLSESARMTTRAEAAYRVPYPNSLRRAVKVIALDPPSAALLDDLSKLPWNGAQFFTAAPADKAKAPGQDALKAWLNDLKGHTLDLVEEVAQSDFVVVVTCAGEDAQSASVIAEICELRHKTLIALIVPKAQDDEAAVVASLKYLRPYARMLVVTQGPDYIETMLTALRA